MRTQRDTQRSKVYAAENACSWTQFGQTIPTDQLQTWAYKNVFSRAWYRRRWGNHAPRITTGARGRGLARGSYLIKLGVASRNPWVMCHEIAHTLTPTDAGHGPEFARVYLFLVERVIGKAEAKELREKFREHRVKVAPAKNLLAIRFAPGEAPAAIKPPKPAKKPRRPRNWTPADVRRAAAKVGATVHHDKNPSSGYPVRGLWDLDVIAPEGYEWVSEGWDLVDIDETRTILSTYAYPESAFTGSDRCRELITQIEAGMQETNKSATV